MAPPVPDRHIADPGRLTLGRAWRLACDPEPGRLGYALRMAAACATTVLVGEIWQVPDLAVPALVTMALWQKDRVTNLVAGLAVNVLILVILAMLYGLIRLTLDHPLGIVVGVAILSFCFFFLGSASKLKPLAYMLGLITVYGLIAVDQAPVGEIATRALLYTDLFLAIPGLVMIGLGLIICPSPRTVLMRAIAGRLRMAMALLRHPDDATRERAQDMLRQGDAGMMANVKMAALERIWNRRDLACLKQAAYSSIGVLALADAAVREGGSPCPSALLETLEEMAAMFEAGDYPADIAPPAVPSNEPALAAMAALIAIFTTPAPEEKPPEEKKSGGFFFPDAFTNPDHVRFAVKGTAAVMTSYFIFKILDWPGIHTCIITCFIVAQPTMGEMISKLMLRIGGALLGAALGIGSIILLMPHLNDITGFLALVFAGAFIAAWVKTGDERIAYAGFQIGLAFFLTDIKDYGPTTDMTVARDRVVGIMLGNFITYAMFTSFWPASAWDRIAATLRGVVRALAAQRDSITPQARVTHAAEVLGAISASQRTLEFAATEPVHMRADTERMSQCGEALRDASRLAEDLLIPERDAQTRARFERLESLAS
ncbi:putative multidrug resistance protein MdtO [Gluconacetobacter diazotrophicus PA1 5]|uniref:FUSC family protein n=1 Tax=Gluconacetobacter diazotrophicus TaxID=33996 RepID=UPI000173C979|nr:FUSC family protein [Gluconacetobacter diazotrophicus]ACI50037.1 putative multidrug resistance protein MdtO [Gluconacetobacter diazotrophicus PA1 5]TWB07883.1 multidrug resistance protein MdtO [Gluconacetobacter diazotrophicus]